MNHHPFLYTLIASFCETSPLFGLTWERTPKSTKTRTTGAAVPKKKRSDLSEIFSGRSAFCTAMDPKRVFLPLVVGALLLPLSPQEFNRNRNESQADVSVKRGGGS